MINKCYKIQNGDFTPADGSTVEDLMSNIELSDNNDLVSGFWQLNPKDNSEMCFQFDEDLFNGKEQTSLAYQKSIALHSAKYTKAIANSTMAPSMAELIGADRAAVVAKMSESINPASEVTMPIHVSGAVKPNDIAVSMTAKDPSVFQGDNNKSGIFSVDGDKVTLTVDMERYYSDIDYRNAVNTDIEAQYSRMMPILEKAVAAEVAKGGLKADDVNWYSDFDRINFLKDDGKRVFLMALYDLRLKAPVTANIGTKGAESIISKYNVSGIFSTDGKGGVTFSIDYDRLAKDPGYYAAVLTDLNSLTNSQLTRLYRIHQERYDGDGTLDQGKTAKTWESLRTDQIIIGYFTNPEKPDNFEQLVLRAYKLVNTEFLSGSTPTIEIEKKKVTE